MASVTMPVLRYAPGNDVARIQQRADSVGSVKSTVTDMPAAPTHSPTESSAVDSLAIELASRPETVFVYALSSPTRLVLEQYLSPQELALSVLEHIPSIPWAAEATVDPVLEYHKTLTQWMPGLITEAEATCLNPAYSSVNALSGRAEAGDVVMLQALASEGRLGTSYLPDTTGYSRTTVGKLLAPFVDPYRGGAPWSAPRIWACMPRRFSGFQRLQTRPLR